MPWIKGGCFATSFIGIMLGNDFRREEVIVYSQRFSKAVIRGCFLKSRRQWWVSISWNWVELDRFLFELLSGLFFLKTFNTLSSQDYLHEIRLKDFENFPIFCF
jgi:hypothetical protein